MLTGQPSGGEENEYEKNNDLDLVDMKANKVAKKMSVFLDQGFTSFSLLPHAKYPVNVQTAATSLKLFFTNLRFKPYNLTILIAVFTAHAKH